MSIANTARGLRMDSHGIWTSDRSAAISYPEQGNAECFQLEDRSYWFRHRNACIASIVRRFPPRGCILDIGGGNGYVTRRLLDEGYAAALLEPGPTGAWNGRVQRGIPDVICATLDDAGLTEGSLPAAGCFDVIEHIADDRAFLARVHTLLEPGGLLYATVPAFGWLWSASDVSAEHHRRYDRRAIGGLLADIGFELEYFSYFFAPLTLPVLLLRALPYKLHLVKRDNLLSHDAEHGTGGGVMASAIEAVLRVEAAQVARGGTLPAGTSCLLVARKPVG